MEILSIDHINDDNQRKTIYLKVKFNPHDTNRWELNHPTLSVDCVYDEDEVVLSHTALLDEGMPVHHFDLTTEDEQKVQAYILKHLRN